MNFSFSFLNKFLCKVSENSSNLSCGIAEFVTVVGIVDVFVEYEIGLWCRGRHWGNSIFKRQVFDIKRF